MNLNCYPVREITFFHDGKIIEPEEVFERLYQGLSQLLLPVNQTFRQQRMREFSSSFPSSERDQQYTLWRKEQPDITATLVFDDRETRNCLVRARTNFDLGSLKKFPNVVYVNDVAGQVHILRESRMYPLETF